MGGLTVRAWMTPQPVSIEVGESALGALDAMVDHGIRHLPVTHGRRVVGVLSFHDLRAALPVRIDLQAGIGLGEREDLRDYAVAEVMTHFPEVVGPETPLSEAAGRLAARRIGCLLVVDRTGALVGILTSTDALRALSLGPAALDIGPDEAREGEIADLVAELEAERGRIRRELDRARRTERDLEEKLLEPGGADVEERGADRAALRVGLALRDYAARRLRAIERAVERSAIGKLTTCDACGGEILLARLRALPGATSCVACARAREA